MEGEGTVCCSGLRRAVSRVGTPWIGLEKYTYPIGGNRPSPLSIADTTVQSLHTYVGGGGECAKSKFDQKGISQKEEITKDRRARGGKKALG